MSTQHLLPNCAIRVHVAHDEAFFVRRNVENNDTAMSTQRVLCNGALPVVCMMYVEALSMSTQRPLPKGATRVHVAYVEALLMRQIVKKR